MTQKRLEIALNKAKTIQEIHDLLYICDYIHTFGIEYKTYTPDDLPPDSVYEYYVNKIGYKTDTSITDSTILYMSTIPKDKKVVEIQNALLIPKYDGTSAAMLFNKQDDKFILTNANTRGKEIGNSIVNTNITDKLNNLIDYLEIETDLNILNIALRGELVLNHKTLDETGNTVNCPASEAAGALNGKMENFINKINELCLQCYEIGILI